MSQFIRIKSRTEWRIKFIRSAHSKWLHSISSEYLDIRDSKGVEKHLSAIKPDIIFHLAAQSLVSISYQTHIDVETNVAAKYYEAKKLGSNVQLMSTTDKVYENVGSTMDIEKMINLGVKTPTVQAKQV